MYAIYNCELKWLKYTTTKRMEMTGRDERIFKYSIADGTNSKTLPRTTTADRYIQYIFVCFRN